MVLIITIIKFFLKRRAKKHQTHQGWYDNNGQYLGNNQPHGANNGPYYYQDTEMQFSKNLRGNETRHPAKIFAERFLHFFQFVLGLTVAGLYGVDLHHAREKGVYADPKWVFAEVCTGIATSTALFYMLAPHIFKNGPPLAARVRLHLPLFLWEAFICLLWLVLFGIFGKMYIGENPEGQSGITRMIHAVWVDLINLVMWVCTAGWRGLRWWKGKSATATDAVEQPAPLQADGEKYPPYQPPQYPANVI
jgi:hypothetical protein